LKEIFPKSQRALAPYRELFPIATANYQPPLQRSITFFWLFFTLKTAFATAATVIATANQRRRCNLPTAVATVNPKVKQR
jgi:hypothetical protein